MKKKIPLIAWICMKKQINPLTRSEIENKKKKEEKNWSMRIFLSLPNKQRLNIRFPHVTSVNTLDKSDEAS